ncbi:MAG TPA: hypothetical protein VHV55_22705 [Pirellulales bacterium]|nr:hypothetical protein [Pirellulales bacterium]
MPNPCCCTCDFVNDGFDRANTSGTDAGRLGPQWSVLSGDWQIADNELTVSAAGAQLACLLNADNPSSTGIQFTVAMNFTAPDGAVLRICMPCNGSPGSHYYEFEVGASGYQQIDDQSSQSNPTGAGPFTGTATVCLQKYSDGKWTMTGQVWGDFVGEVISSVTNNSFVIEVVSTPSPITITSITGTNIGTTDCTGNCNNCGRCPRSAQFKAVVTGWTDGDCGDGTTPAPCSEANGTYILTGAPGGCYFSYSGFVTVCGTPIGVGAAIGFSYDPLTDTTTIRVGSYTTTRPGKPDCTTAGFGTLTVGPISVGIIVSDDFVLCPSMITIVFTSLLTG